MSAKAKSNVVPAGDVTSSSSSSHSRGSYAEVTYTRLRLVSNCGSLPVEIPLLETTSELVLGRDQTVSDFCLQGKAKPHVSKRHLCLKRKRVHRRGEGHKWHVKDLNSTNG